MRTAESVLLTCWPPAPEAAERVDAQLRRIDRDVSDGVGFRQHRHRARRRMDATLRLGCRHALHAMASGLELELRIGALAGDAQDHLLVAAQLGRRRRDDLDRPAIAFRVARVHPAEIAGEQCRLVAARAGADFEKDVAVVVRILRQQHLLEVGCERCHLLASPPSALPQRRRAFPDPARSRLPSRDHARRRDSRESARRPARSPHAPSSTNGNGRGRASRLRRTASRRARPGAARAGRAWCGARVSSLGIDDHGNARNCAEIRDRRNDDQTGARDSPRRP